MPSPIAHARACATDELARVFRPAIPEQFHRHYCLVHEFVGALEQRCSNEAHVRRLRRHASYGALERRWNLPIYYQLRFQDIRSALEDALTPAAASAPTAALAASLLGAVPAAEALLSAPARALCAALSRTWASDVVLTPLVPRLFKLSLQLVSRYVHWLAAACALEPHADASVDAAPTPTTTPAAAAAVVVVLSDESGADDERRAHAPPTPVLGEAHQVHAYADAARLCGVLEPLFAALLKARVSAVPRATQLPAAAVAPMTSAMRDAVDVLRAAVPRLATSVRTAVTRRCVAELQPIRAVPAAYRMMSRAAPRSASTYVPRVLEPLAAFVSSATALSAAERSAWTSIVAADVTSSFASLVTEVVHTVQQSQAFLQKLVRRPGASAAVATAGAGSGATAPNAALTDVDKILLQLYIDVQEYGARLATLDVRGVGFERLEELVADGRQFWSPQ
jgi:hypothetical protein